VPLLLGLGEEIRALAAALDSGDSDLVYLVLFRMQRTMPLQQFLGVLASRPHARSLFAAYCARMVRACECVGKASSFLYSGCGWPIDGAF
jgi:hypothetical protein